MRLITDEQHAQIETAIDDFHSASIFRPSCQEGAVDRCKCFACATDRIIAAIITLQALPEVEVVGYVYGVMTDSCTRRSMANIKADIELKSGAPLYATKEPS